mgnify:CR=1 FL=1
MNIKTIRELAGILQDANLTALELEEGETRIRLEKSADRSELCSCAASHGFHAGAGAGIRRAAG